MPNLIEIPRRGQLRIWGRGEFLPGEATAPADRVVVEWAGRTGHASSYGLLGATAPDGPMETRIEIAHEGAPFDGSLAGANDHVVFGLLDDYRAAIRAASSVFTFPMIVQVAAHGAIGSSELGFERLTDLLAPLVWCSEDERTDDIVELWWKRAWTARDWVNDVDLPDSYRDLRGTTESELAERDRFEAELRREVGPGHRLFGRRISVLARDTARDDVLVVRVSEPRRARPPHLRTAITGASPVADSDVRSRPRTVGATVGTAIVSGPRR